MRILSVEFSFSIWDLMILTTFVASIFAMPVVALQIVLAVATFITILGAPLLIMCWITASKRANRAAVIERLFVLLLIRSVGLSSVLLIFGGVTIACHSMLG